MGYSVSIALLCNYLYVHIAYHRVLIGRLGAGQCGGCQQRLVLSRLPKRVVGQVEEGLAVNGTHSPVLFA